MDVKKTTTLLYFPINDSRNAMSNYLNENIFNSFLKNMYKKLSRTLYLMALYKKKSYLILLLKKKKKRF